MYLPETLCAWASHRNCAKTPTMNTTTWNSPNYRQETHCLPERAIYGVSFGCNICFDYAINALYKSSCYNLPYCTRYSGFVHYPLPGNRLATSIYLLWRLTHWGRVTHMCVNKLTIIGSDNGLSPGRRQKPLSEPMLEYCWLDPWEQTSVKS